RLVLIDPDETAAPAVLNVLDGDEPDVTVDHLVGIFRRIYQAYWGPRTDDILRSACLTLMRRPGATLAHIPQLLADPRFRAPYLDGIDDPVGLGGFWAWYEDLSEAQRAQVVGPLMNKLRAFLLRRFVRHLIGDAPSSFDMSRVLDGGVCLVRIPKGQLGDETARLVGSFVVARTWQAATARARLPQSQRRDAALYVDECQNFLNLPHSLDEMLAEARGYRLSVVLAHQHLDQLPRDMRAAVAANARNKLLMTISPDDARPLERHVAPYLSAHDLAHLAAHQVAARLVVGGQDQAPFTLTTRPLPEPVTGRADRLRAVSRAQHGRSSEQRIANARDTTYGSDGPNTVPYSQP
ncbi:MAG TPA: type IV secretory system conjugative DNA transfer family protein, partial [Nitriliruptorales bacterium]